MYLKKVEAAGNVLVPCNDDKYSAFAGCVNYRPRSELDELMANMRAAGIASRADAEESAARLAAARAAVARPAPPQRLSGRLVGRAVG